MKTKSISFIGGGRVTKILLQGLINKNVGFKSIMVCDTSDEVLKKLKDEYPFIKTTGSTGEAASREIVFIALHPPVIGETVSKLKNVINVDSLIISLAPKFSIEKLSGLLGTKRVVRMIPNATSYMNMGYNPICFSNSIEEWEKASVIGVLKELGHTFETEEHKLEAYAIASAMLPTYFWFQWNEMESISKKMGLTEAESREAIYYTIKASLELMYNTELNYKEITDLIPVKPIGENESDIKEILNTKLLGLFEKIKP